MGSDGGSTDKAGERSREEQSIEMILHVILTSLVGWGGWGPPVVEARGWPGAGPAECWCTKLRSSALAGKVTGKLE